MDSEQIVSRLDRLESEMHYTTKALSRIEGMLEVHLPGLPDRVSSLERAKSWAMGAAAVIAAIISMAMRFILD